MRKHLCTALCVVAFLMLPVAVIAPKGLVLLLIFAALTVLPASIHRDQIVRRTNVAVVSLLVMVAIAALSAIWSLTPTTTLKTSLSFAATVGMAIVFVHGVGRLTELARNRVASGFFYGGGLGFLLLAVEMSSNAWIGQSLKALIGADVVAYEKNFLSLKPSFSVGALYLWPWGLIIWRRYSWKVAGTPIVCALIILFMGIGDAPKVGLVVGGVALLLGLFIPRAAPTVLAVAVGLSVLAMPLIPGALPDPLVSAKNLSFLSNSALHRLTIWQTTATHIGKKPILGSGFDTARALYSKDEATVRRFLPDQPDKSWENGFEPIPLHPHNGVLQVWLEMGVVGALAFLAIIMFLLRAIAVRSDKIGRGVCYASMATGLIIASVSFGAWQSWWLATLVLIAGAVVLTIDPYSDSGETVAV